MSHSFRKSIAVLTLCALQVAPLSVSAASQTFSDVPPDHPAYEAVEFLKERGILTGYGDGTFKPHQKVNRAEALKIMVAPFISQEELANVSVVPSSYTDIATEAWYKPYVEFARVAKVIDGPPQKTRFNGEQPVIKVEFLKMLFLSSGADTNAYSEIRLPLAKDASNIEEWYYPYLRYAVSTSTAFADSNGQLTPGTQLTRAQTAILLHRYILYREKKRTQALLDSVDADVLLILGRLEQNDITEAEYASARALIAARGALTSEPNMPILQGTVKIIEAFRALVRGYRAALNTDYNATIQLSGDAWNLADRANQFSPDLQKISDQVKETATEMANTARSVQIKQ